jgi:uncharacterized membrane protein YfcA
VSVTIFLPALVIIIVSCTVQGSIGFGSNLVAIPTIVHFAPELVPGSVLVAVTVMNLLMLRRDRAGLEVRPVGSALLGRALGTVVGVGILGSLSDDGLRLVVGIAILAMVAVAASGIAPRRTVRTMFGAGTVSGVSAAVAGIGGPPVALLYQNAPGENIRGSMGGFFVVGMAMTLTGLAVAGEMGLDEFGWGIALIPGAIIGYLLSGPLLPVVDRGWTRPAILVISATAAVVLLLRVAFG